jgi:GNAT superfamily N-acetyltransferase
VFRLLSLRDEVSPYFDDIVKASNSERHSFGFLPESVYRDFIQHQQIIVAIGNNTNAFIGYTIFAGALPTAKVRQTYVHPDWRQKGIGEALISEVIKRCEQLNYLTLRATVGDDLINANAFYEKMGFVALATKPGGKTKKRILIIRARELDTPSLLNFAHYRSKTEPGILLNIPEAGPAPLFLIDLNFVFDLVRQRKSDEALALVAAAFENSVRLAISAEFIAELERNTHNFPNDPILKFDRGLPIVQCPISGAKQLADELAPLIFPDRLRLDRLTDQDRSDIRHLTTVILETASGFITSEKAILRQAPILRERYSIEVVSPAMFASADSELTPLPPPIGIAVDRRTITSRVMTENDHEATTRLATSQGISVGVVRTALSRGTSTTPRSRAVVKDDYKLIAAATWERASASGIARLYLFADYADEAAELAVDHLLDVASRSSCAVSPTNLWISLGSRDALIRERAIRAGFSFKEKMQGAKAQLHKICFGVPITSKSWPSAVSIIREKFGLVLPPQAPNFGNIDQSITISTTAEKHAVIKIKSIEDFLSPTILALPDRPSVIVPIWPIFAEALFQGTLQRDMLSGPRAGIVTQKCYLSDKKSLSRIPDHGIIVFYESAGQGKSRGRSAAIALGRIQRRYLASETSASELAQLRGVLSDNDIQAMAKGQNLCVTEFDNLMRFRSPVALAKLKEIGCADGANLVTARSLDTTALIRLIDIGEPYASADS